MNFIRLLCLACACAVPLLAEATAIAAPPSVTQWAGTDLAPIYSWTPTLGSSHSIVTPHASAIASAEQGLTLEVSALGTTGTHLSGAYAFESIRIKTLPNTLVGMRFSTSVGMTSQLKGMDSDVSMSQTSTLAYFHIRDYKEPPDPLSQLSWAMWFESDMRLPSLGSYSLRNAYVRCNYPTSDDGSIAFQSSLFEMAVPCDTALGLSMDASSALGDPSHRWAVDDGLISGLFTAMSDDSGEVILEVNFGLDALIYQGDGEVFASLAPTFSLDPRTLLLDSDASIEIVGGLGLGGTTLPEPSSIFLALLALAAIRPRQLQRSSAIGAHESNSNTDRR